MALLRFLYRKRQFLFVALCGTTFWLIYIFLSLPQPTKPETKPGFSENLFLTQNYLRNKDHEESVKEHEESIKDKNINNVIAIPNILKKDEGDLVKDRKDPDQKDADKNIKIEEKKSRGDKSKKLSSEDKQIKKDAKLSNTKGNNTQQMKNATVAKLPDKGGFNIFETIKNKTFEMGESVKNKTLQKLSEFGVFLPKQYKKLVFDQGVWPLNISLEDVGSIMKDTAYLQKEEKISINYPKLLSSKINQTVGNETIFLKNLTMTNSVGFCDCIDYECYCCARIALKKMHVNNTACTNFTFMTKSQELDYRFSFDKKLLDKKIISAEQPPTVCLGSISKVGAVCTRFLNVTSKVMIDEDHKLHVVGCLEFSLMLFNRTVSAFPVDCFQLPSHEHKSKEYKAIHNFGNWMP